MDYAVAFALELKKRNNSKPIGNLTGEILSITPLKIGILSNGVILDNCIITKTFKSLLDNNLAVNGDKVLIISDASGEIFYAIDKVV
ncbi:DUF2577 domain-containing protein [Clostridium sp. CF012]|uniref:DUF2577 domain-containing protein n=1 Tax=Clostridium sp. CF012 TaxID=2843319 RepID=UPI001C0DA463|nr:DUF2577 domain-containing protein [Clostridium sp. CF012]MBU3146889.1 DUF2577 domain-containing protein [Clostridium sp. CF012]